MNILNSNNFVHVGLRGRAFLGTLTGSCGFVPGSVRPFAGAGRLAGCALDAYRVIYKKKNPPLITAGGCGFD